MKYIGLSAAVLVSLSMSACLTTGEDFPSETTWIRKDATTQKDVNMVLGTPFAVGNSGGVGTWTYAFYKYQLFGKSFHKELKFYWHPNQAVKHFSFSSSFPSDLPGGEKAVKANPPVARSTTAPTPSSGREAKAQAGSRKAYPRY